MKRIESAESSSLLFKEVRNTILVQVLCSHFVQMQSTLPTGPGDGRYLADQVSRNALRGS
ncbi:hypothetical protein T4E_4798 [Trichinella pseudospiralis]|uniref:Uncharacterized protein n=1 Tax=Trichinella pseudospiralis TaxID=6337 RepID=A0A0V0YE72_TRIPS|nr:hypothetical protein T4E_4798 [Trichinella pseudospiralis]